LKLTSQILKHDWNLMFWGSRNEDSNNNFLWEIKSHNVCLVYGSVVCGSNIGIMESRPMRCIAVRLPYWALYLKQRKAPFRFMFGRPSVRGCHWADYPRYLMLGTFKKICPETPNLLKIGQTYRALYMKTWVLLNCWQLCEIFCSSTAVQMKHIFAPYGCILFRATCGKTTISRESIVAFL